MKFGNQKLLERRLTVFARATAVVCIFVGLVVFLGWLIDAHVIIRISPGFATMKVNTAISYFLLGIGLWSALAVSRNSHDPAAARGKSKGGRVSTLCAVMVALISFLSLCEYLFNCDLGIDNLFVQDHHLIHNPYPGRMARMTALDFVLLATALLTIDFEPRSGKRPAQWLVIPVLLDSYVALLGYSYNVESLYSVGGYSSMALHTALLMFLISIGLLAARPGKGLMVVATDTTAGGWIFRRLLPTAVLLMPLFGLLRLKGQEAGLYSLEFGTALLVMMNVFVLSFLIWWAAVFIRLESLDRKDTEQKLQGDEERAREEAAVLEDRVRERTARLEETVAELEHSTYTISHNLRAPVRAVLAFSEFLSVDFGEKVGEKGRDYINRIRTSAERMDRLIEGVLAYARVSRREIALSRVDLDKLLEELVPDYTAPDTDIKIQHPLGTVRANESLLEQAVSNLIENAVKFVRPGSKPQIEVWSEPEDGSVRLVVCDHGIGVPREAGDKIFGNFERGNEEYPGTGVGLAIVKRALERMNGRVGYDSSPGQGSKFWVELQAAA